MPKTPKAHYHPDASAAGIKAALDERRFIQRLPYGFTRTGDKSLRTEPLQIAKVRKAFALVAGRTIRKVAASVGLTPALVHRILTNPVYWTGNLYRLNEPTWKVPPLVKPPPWSKVPYILRSTSRQRAGRLPSFLLGKWLRGRR